MLILELTNYETIELESLLDMLPTLKNPVVGSQLLETLTTNPRLESIAIKVRDALRAEKLRQEVKVGFIAPTLDPSSIPKLREGVRAEVYILGDPRPFKIIQFFDAADLLSWVARIKGAQIRPVDQHWIVTIRAEQASLI